MFFVKQFFKQQVSEESFLPEMNPFADEVISVSSETSKDSWCKDVEKSDLRQYWQMEKKIEMQRSEERIRKKKMQAREKVEKHISVFPAGCQLHNYITLDHTNSILHCSTQHHSIPHHIPHH